MRALIAVIRKITPESEYFLEDSGNLSYSGNKNYVVSMFLLKKYFLFPLSSLLFNY